MSNANSRDDGVRSNFLREFESVFTSNNEVGRIRKKKFLLRLIDYTPIKLDPYKCCRLDQAIIENFIDFFLANDLIQESNSRYAFPVFLSEDLDDGKGRQLCVNYRKLNEITTSASIPIPPIPFVIQRLLNTTYFSVLNISYGFHHIKLNPRDRERTAFITSTNELYEWKVMPSGLKNSSKVCHQTFWKILLRYDLESFAQNYIDNVVVFSKTYDDHIRHLSTVLRAFQEENIKLASDECQILRKSINFLGFLISENQIEPNPKKVAAILAFETPKNVSEVRSFLGKLIFYRKFIKNRVHLVHPLTYLLRRDVRFTWGPQQAESFRAVKQLFRNGLVLRIFDAKKNILIYADVRDFAIEAVLKQNHGDQEYPVAYFSTKLLNYQMQKYSLTELKCLAAVMALKCWRIIILKSSSNVKVFIDHLPLIRAMQSNQGSSRLLRLISKLSQYSNLTLSYKPSVEI